MPSTERRIPASEITRDPSSYVDPQGFLFHWQDRILRCVDAAARGPFDQLLADGTLERLSTDFNLVRSWREEVSIAGHDGALILGHEKIAPVTFCAEWGPSMLRTAARATLDIQEELACQNLGLQDAYPWNVLFDGVVPRFVDVTSIVPADRRVLWPAQEQFEAYFFRPLVLSAEGKGAAARALLTNNIEGIPLRLFFKLASTGFKLRHPGTGLMLLADRALQKSAASKSWVYQFAESATREVPADTRRAFVRSLRRRIDAISLDAVNDPWESYYAELGADVDPAIKLDAVGGVLARLKPETVLDLGCNTGVFSFLAADRGGRVVAVDSSEACIEGVYRRAVRDGARITPLLSDVVCPTATGGFMGTQYPPLWDRVRSDVVLCLGLMHHLHINGRQPFDRIARLLDATAGKAVIFEFVAMEDTNVPRISGRRPVDYTLDTVEAALRGCFPKITRLTSDRPTRCLLVCER
jgi:SAM-dependent methyltransferase